MKTSESCPNRICLVGFAGCGKSTIGKKLARKFGYQFIDTDALFEAQEKMTIEAFFEQFGEPAFRQKEYLLLQSLLSIDQCVIATGGGMPCFRDAMDLMLQSATVVYICLSPSQLVKRLQQSKSKRPLFKNCSDTVLPKLIENMLDERELFYLKAHHVVNGINLKSNISFLD